MTQSLVSETHENFIFTNEIRLPETSCKWLRIKYVSNCRNAIATSYLMCNEMDGIIDIFLTGCISIETVNMMYGTGTY
jgi:hypothetical protein